MVAVGSGDGSGVKVGRMVAVGSGVGVSDTADAQPVKRARKRHPIKNRFQNKIVFIYTP